MNGPEGSPAGPVDDGRGAALSLLDRAGASVDRWSERAAYHLFRLGIYVTMPALVALVTVDVLLRYVFNAPLQWGRDVNGLLLLMTIFCALPHAWDRAYHIRMEVFYTRLTRERRRGADVIASVVGVVWFAMMALQGAWFVPFMIRTGETGEDLEAQIWPFMAFLAFCAAVMVGRLFANPSADEERVRHVVHEPGGGQGAAASGGHEGADDDEPRGDAS